MCKAYILGDCGTKVYLSFKLCYISVLICGDFVCLGDHVTFWLFYLFLMISDILCCFYVTLILTFLLTRIQVDALGHTTMPF